MIQTPQPVIDLQPSHGKLELLPENGFSWTPAAACGEYNDRASYVFYRPDGIITKISVRIIAQDAGRWDREVNHSGLGRASEIVGAR